MKSNDFRFICSKDSSSECELKTEVSTEIGMLFDNVMSTVVDYFEEAILV